MNDIRNESSRFAEANIYSLDNQYLNSYQKLEVEIWFQFPGIISFTVLCASLIYNAFHPIPTKFIIVCPLIIDLIFGIYSWYLYVPRFNKLFFLSVGHSYIQWLLTIFTISTLIYHEKYWWSAIVLSGKIGFLGLISPSNFISQIFSRKYKMHPKYAFFKEFYHITFPFEENIQKNAINEDINIDFRPVRELSKSLYLLFMKERNNLSETQKLGNILLERYQEGTRFHDLAKSNLAYLTDLQSLLYTIINMEFQDGRELEKLALHYYEGLLELSNLGHEDSKKELKNLQKIMEKADENGFEELDGLFISIKSGLLHKQENFESILNQLKW